MEIRIGHQTPVYFDNTLAYLDVREQEGKTICQRNNQFEQQDNDSQRALGIMTRHEYVAVPAESEFNKRT